MNDQAHARTTDPSTSHLAAASVKPLTLTRSRIAVLAYLDGELGGTQEQITDTVTGFPPSRIRTAVRELADRGLVRNTGHRRPTKAGRDAIVWAITSEGIAAYYDPDRPLYD